MKIKTIFLICFFIFISAETFSQHDSLSFKTPPPKDSTFLRRNEISFGVANLNTLFSGNLYDYENGYYFNWLNGWPEGPWDYGWGYDFLLPSYGLSYKYHFANYTSLRAGMDFMKMGKNEDIKSQYSYGTPSSTENGSLNYSFTKMKFNAGYQLGTLWKKIYIYGGLDFFYEQGENNTIVKYADTSGSGYSRTQTGKCTRTRTKASS